MEPATPVVDVESEIARLEVEMDDLRRNERYATFIAGGVSSLAYASGPAWLAIIDRLEVAVIVVGVVVAFAVISRLNKIRFNQIQGEIAALKLWSNADYWGHRRTMRIVRAMEGKDTP